MPKVSYTHHWTNESEADAQAAVREELAQRLRAVGGSIRPSHSVGFEYHTNGNGERFIEGWQPYRILAQVNIPQPVIEQPVVEEPEAREPEIAVPQAVCDKCSQGFAGRNIQGAKNKLRAHTRKVHSLLATVEGAK